MPPKILAISFRHLSTELEKEPLTDQFATILNAMLPEAFTRSNHWSQYCAQVELAPALAESHATIVEVDTQHNWRVICNNAPCVRSVQDSQAHLSPNNMQSITGIQRLRQTNLLSQYSVWRRVLPQLLQWVDDLPTSPVKRIFEVSQRSNTVVNFSFPSVFEAQPQEHETRAGVLTTME